MTMRPTNTGEFAIINGKGRVIEIMPKQGAKRAKLAAERKYKTSIEMAS